MGRYNGGNDSRFKNTEYDASLDVSASTASSVLEASQLPQTPQESQKAQFMPGSVVKSRGTPKGPQKVGSQLHQRTDSADVPEIQDVLRQELIQHSIRSLFQQPVPDPEAGVAKPSRLRAGRCFVDEGLELLQ